ncbi:MAG TPA: acyl-CoA dehydrogenase family protein [Acidimicrobiales bacterium]|nr:acyl-CoA dehydrogenase family protein [Acidimicrobiales bacterium]
MIDEQILLGESVRKILATDAGSAISLWPSPAWLALTEAGMTGVGTAEALGGSGGTFSDAATLVFEAGRLGAFVPLAETIMLGSWLDALATWPITGGAETVAAELAPSVLLRRSGSEVIVEGTLRHVPWGRVATRVVTVIEADGVSFLVALTPESFSVEENENLAGEPRDTLRVRAAHLREDEWLSSPVSLVDVRRRGALARSIAMAGAMTSVLEMTASHARDREQFGRPIARFQAVQQLLAQLAGEVFAAVTAARVAADAVDSRDGSVEAIAASVRIARGATKSARIAHQIHGAIGVTAEYPLHKYTNRLWSWRDEFGGATEWSRALSQHVRQHGEWDRLWPLLTNNFEEQS